MHPAKHATLNALRRHVERLTRRLQGLDRRSRQYGWARLGLFFAGAAATFIAFQLGSAAWGWGVLVLAVAAFVFTARQHRRIDDSIRRHRLWRHLKQSHIARMTLDWPRLPKAASFSPDPDHPYERDLDLIGPRSLHHLLNTASSQGGSERLRTWLREPLLDPPLLAARQALVQELATLSVFRDRLSLHGTLSLEDPETPWDGERLQAWLNDHTPGRSRRPLLVLLSSLAGLNAILFILYLTTSLPALWAVSLTIYVGIYLFAYWGIRHLFDEAYHLEKALRGFRAVAAFLETYRYGPYPHLAALCTPFRDAQDQPSRHLKRITRVAAAASSQKSEVLLVVLNTLGPWDLFFAHRLDRLKETLRAQLPVWLNTWYTLEALCALATFADLNPDYRIPTVETPEALGRKAIFVGNALGHPLLGDTQRVCNDFTIDSIGDVTIITGSNMSGKSTFLRTLGINLCLAFAGGPVCATHCQTQPFRLFTSINVVDSVNDGISHFYAEVRRLKRLLDALDADTWAPLFFLIDEIFRGTNNRERLLGSRAYVRALAGRRATGLITTHDLELTRLADEIGGVYNAHFREDVIDGRLAFDYRLRPAPCPTTNALKIMQMEGLPVEPTALPSVD